VDVSTLPDRLRIISDIHLGHPGSLVTDPDQLAPLFEDVPAVIFNGDTVEMRYRTQREQGWHDLERVAAVCRGTGARPFFINGNHDPIVSAVSHLDLLDGAVLITHGDFLFHDISPWSDEARAIGAAHTQMLGEMGPDVLVDFEQRLSAGKLAALSIELHEARLPQGPLARVVTFLQECWPPWRPLQIVKCWVETPGRALELMRVFRPRAKIILIGHTHLGGIWKLGGRVVINTGSFLPLARLRIVDLRNEDLEVRIAVRDAGGDFHAGKVIARFDARSGMPAES
jgi:predicted phosphodiesterase